MFKLLLSLILAFSLSYSKTYDELARELDNLSTEQVDTMYKVFNYGVKHDLQWSLTAIAWRESMFGVLKLPLDNGSDRGLMQINLNTYFKRYGIKDTRWNRSKYGTKLVIDDYHCMDAAIDELRYWESKKKSWENYRKVWGGYNDGHTIGKAGLSYADDIALRIKVLSDKLKGATQWKS